MLPASWTALLAAVVVGAPTITVPTPAFASASARTSKQVLPAPARPARQPGLTTGFANDMVLTDPPLSGVSSATQSYWIGKAASVGAGIVRVNVPWISIAPVNRPPGFQPADPGSPGYYWPTIDQDVRAIVARGLTPALMLYWAPRWAEGPNMPGWAQPGSWEPDPAQFAAFATAAATRYSGDYPDPLEPGHFLPRVSYWQAWNEPNLEYYLSPMWTSDGQPNSPILYAPLLNAFYSAVKAVSTSNFVVEAGTSPSGDPPDSNNRRVGLRRMSPVPFYRALFCVHSSVACRGPVHLDAIDHHPYEIPPPQFSATNPDDVLVPDLWKIRNVLNAGLRAGTVLPAVPKQIWIGELAWDSNPPSAGVIAAPIAIQACYVNLAMYLLWREGANTILWLQLRDSAPTPNWQGAFHWSGMYYYGGAPKPSATALRFPVVATRLDPDHVRVWGRAPRAGVLTIQRLLSSGRKVVLARLMVSTDQVFLATVRARGTFAIQATVGSLASLPWTQQIAKCPHH